MLQIRLSKGSAGDGGGAAAKPPPPADTVTVVCPDHLVIADLPVAKSLGAVTSSAAAVRTVGRRSRRNLGERVHFCVRCDFPIALYGRLVPCEHAFCLTCARSDASCYLCDERIQKIQSIKMMEGIFICAAPHCLKSFLKRSEFESHIHETHPNLLQSNTKKEGGTEEEARASSTDTHKQSFLQETSTARAPPKSGFSPITNSQQQDRDERTYRHQSSDHPPSMVPPHLKPTPFQSPHQRQPGDVQADNNPPQGFDNPNSWINQPQSFMSQSGPPNQQVSDQLLSEKHAGNPSQSSFSDYPPLQPPLPPNYQLPLNANQAVVPPAAFSYPLSAEGSQQYYSAPYEIPRPELMPAGGPAQGSVLGYSPAPAGIASFAGSAPRPWGAGQMVVPLDRPFMLTQGLPEGYMNLADSQGRIQSLQGDGSQLAGGWLLNHSQIGQESQLQGVSAVNSDNKGVLAQLPQPVALQVPLPPPPPPPLPLPMSQQLNAGNFSSFSTANQEGQRYG
ncbi:Cbl proto-oncogene, E3 ubiquitin protein ligase-like 1 [Musa troglodytarum]|uniref:RING-type E3 ubiquitin transferase n=1 Tax=Musa troglodytarum TaxID=320322 RepID=A0A9E7FDW0_9LILI|nr:Cbl proto-oncogene, E3 ubiquitin protein ligase-like 1 [Musa troglodytarum]